MAEPKTDEEKRKHLHELMEGFRSAMLVTRTPSGGLHARPLAIAGRRGEHLFFATAIDSPKAREIEEDPHVNVSMQNGGRFVSLSGTARIVIDRALIEELWSEAWKVWFPLGKQDPSICLLVVDVLDAQYWDKSGVQGLRYLFQAAKAYVTGSRAPEGDNSQTAKVRL
jgi:general stress protein 26